MEHTYKRDEVFFVPPNCSAAVAFAVIFAVLIGCIVCGVAEGCVWQFVIAGVFVFFVVLYFSRAYLLDAEGIQVKLFACFTIRKIPWERVGKVYVFRRWKDRTPGKHYGRVYDEGRVVISMKWCVSFEPGVDDPSSFCFKHPFDSIGIHIPKKRIEEYIGHIHRFYTNILIVDDKMI